MDVVGATSASAEPILEHVTTSSSSIPLGLRKTQNLTTFLTHPSDGLSHLRQLPGEHGQRRPRRRCGFFRLPSQSSFLPNKFALLLSSPATAAASSEKRYSFELLKDAAQCTLLKQLTDTALRLRLVPPSTFKVASLHRGRTFFRRHLDVAQGDAAAQQLLLKLKRMLALARSLLLPLFPAPILFLGEVDRDCDRGRRTLRLQSSSKKHRPGLRSRNPSTIECASMKCLVQIPKSRLQ